MRKPSWATSDAARRLIQGNVAPHMRRGCCADGAEALALTSNTFGLRLESSPSTRGVLTGLH